MKIRRRASKPAPKTRKDYSAAMADLMRDFLASDPTEGDLAAMEGQLAHLYGFIGGVAIVNGVDIEALAEVTEEAYQGGMLSALRGYVKDPGARAGLAERKAR